MASLLYENGIISVDCHFARFGAKSYAIDKINSVDVRVTPATHAMLTFLIILTVLFGLISLSSPSAVSIFGFIIFGGLAFWKYRNPNLPTFKLYLTTSSSEAQAFESKDEDEVHGLRRAIEQAMTTTPV